MSKELFDVSLAVLMTFLAISLLLCFARLLWGPNVPNRTVAFDLISIHAVGIFALFAVSSESYVLLEGATVTAVLGFLGTVMFARYLERTPGRTEEQERDAIPEAGHRIASQVKEE